MLPSLGRLSRRGKARFSVFTLACWGKLKPSYFYAFPFKKHPVTFSNIPCIIEVMDVAAINSQKSESH
jgi:hypothetical protein